MIENLPVTVAIVITCIAVYTDLKWRIIPNKLTFPAIGIGVIFYIAQGIYNGDVWTVCSGGIGAFAAFAVGYALWITGGWAGGDVKLFTAYGALLPSYAAPGSAGFYPFLVTILFNSVIIAVPFVVVYALVRKALGKSVFYDSIKITELEEGMIPAELIYKKDRKIFRTISRLGVKPAGAEIYADPTRAAGLTQEQVKNLKRLVRTKKLENRLKVKRGMPFAPLLAVGLLIGVFYGDLYWMILSAFL